MVEREPPETASRRISVQEAGAPLRVAKALRQLLARGPQGARPLVLCIGSDRSTGDSLGPLVGTMLSRGSSFPWQIRGTLHEPVHAINLPAALTAAKDRHGLILAVDASLGAPENVGGITVGSGPIYPGAGVHKELPPVGDLHITATVNAGGRMEYAVLQNTRLSFVMDLACTVAAGLWGAACDDATALAASRTADADPNLRWAWALAPQHAGDRSHLFPAERGTAAPTRTDAAASPQRTCTR